MISCKKWLRVLPGEQNSDSDDLIWTSDVQASQTQTADNNIYTTLLYVGHGTFPEFNQVKVKVLNRTLSSLLYFS